MAEQKDTLAELRRLAEAARKHLPANITQLVTLSAHGNAGKTVVAIQVGVDDAEKLLDLVEAAKELDRVVRLGSMRGRRPADSAMVAFRAALAAIEGDEGRGGR